MGCLLSDLEDLLPSDQFDHNDILLSERMMENKNLKSQLNDFTIEIDKTYIIEFTLTFYVIYTSGYSTFFFGRASISHGSTPSLMSSVSVGVPALASSEQFIKERNLKN